MSEKRGGETIIGKLVGFSKRWNPFSTEVRVQVRVDSKVINIPIDYRQQQYIQKEHPVGSNIMLSFSNGNWHIYSKPVINEFMLAKDGFAS